MILVARLYGPLNGMYATTAHHDASSSSCVMHHDASYSVADDHFAVVANKFIIDTMDLSNPDYYMASSNMKDVGRRTGLWSAEDQAAGFFSFKKVYSPNAGPLGSSQHKTRIMTHMMI